jgi:hypothetical protein
VSASAITLLAGGWSASGVDLHWLPGKVIAVNDAAIYAPRVDFVVSMDRMWVEARFARVVKFGKSLWLRRSTLRNIVRWQDVPRVTAFDCDHTSTTLSVTPDTLNGTHSGFCALNLAYLLRPRRLYLVGLDSRPGPKGERHWFPDYAWKNGGGSKPAKIAEWSKQYDTAATQLRSAGIEVWMYGASSVRCFNKIDREGLKTAWQSEP